MIKNKDDYFFYLEADKIALKKQRKRPHFLADDIWKYQRQLRKTEYIFNCKKGLFGKIILKLNFLILERMSIRLGFEIPLNVFGPGLSIAHRGTITVNHNAKVGANCRIHNNITIGANNGSPKAPIIGDNVFIGPCASIFGDITLANDIAIGANSVVNKSFLEEGVTIAGSPAKVVNKNRGSELNVIKATEKLVLQKTINA